MINRLTAFIFCSVLLFTTSVVKANTPLVKAIQPQFVIKPFDAMYDMYRQGDKLGGGKRSLKALGNHTYSLSLESDLEWLIFSDRRKEESTFHHMHGHLTPVSYAYERTGTGRDKELSIKFNPDHTLTIKPKPKKSPDIWDDGLLDEMSLHVQIQADLIAGKKTFDYNVLTNSGKLKNYQFEIIGHELITVGFGRFDAVKVARVYDKDKFYAQHAWFIPELNYTLARLWRMKKGVEQYDLIIRSYQESLIQ
jgi:hypothetical protein